MPRKKTTPEQSLHYWRCYAKDIETSVRFRLLSWAGQGMAWRLFNLQFLNGQIPVDPSQIARMLGAGESEFLREWPSLEEFFPVSESGGRRNPRQEEERNHCLGIIKTRREVAGGKSDPVEPEGTAIGVPNGVPNGGQEVQQVTTRTKNQEPRTSNQEVMNQELSIGLTPAKQTVSAELVKPAFEWVGYWDQFVNCYPKRNGATNKAKAEVKFKSLVKSDADAVMILEGVKRYKEHCDHKGKTNTEFVQQMTTWLNAKGWTEDYGVGGNLVDRMTAERDRMLKDAGF